MKKTEARKKVVHVSSLHPRYDIRIFHKQAVSLASAGYDVSLVVADGCGSEVRDGVYIVDAGRRASNRVARTFVTPLRTWFAALKLDGDVYHFHDPDLLIGAFMLRCFGNRVVYDSHEDMPRNILGKSWIAPWLRRFVACSFELFENFAVRRLSAVVGATPHIAERFSTRSRRVVAISNFPLLSEVDGPCEPAGDGRTVCYVGGISRIRGAVEMIRALEYVDARLLLAGLIEDAATETELRALPGWAKVDYRGEVSRAEVRRILSQSCAGLLFFHAVPNHVDAQPNKMFEYMSAAIPVLASDFRLWRSIIEESAAGLLADPLDPHAIAHCIQRLLDDPVGAREMGQSGRKAVLQKFLWSTEEAKLLTLYRELLR